MATRILDHKVIEVLKDIAGDAGQKISRPSFHPFPARLPLSVAESLIQNISAPHATILDPMVGSGTTIVAAKKLGREALGFDLDPLALLITRCAVHDYDIVSLKELKLRILDRAKIFAISNQAEFSLQKLFQHEEAGFIRFWFPESSQAQLSALAEAIREEPEGANRDFAWVVFSSLIVAKSAGASFALDISRSRPHKRYDKPIVLPFVGWDRRFDAAIRNLPFSGIPSSVHCRVSRADARVLPVQNDSVDLILTSPPYLNAIDYMRAHKFSLIWMGYPLQKLRNLRGTMIGSERGLWQMNGIPDKLESKIEQAPVEKRRRALVRQYLSDLQRVLLEMHRVLRSGGIAILVLGPAIISPGGSDAVRVVTEIGRPIGLELISSTSRTLNPLRRSLPFPSTLVGNPLAARMREEVIAAFRKEL
ncbi:MAG: DNA methyltransferase [Syntrophobacteraceae bacterium]